MGRRTHESIGRPLPGRHNIVLSRDPDYRAEGCDVAANLDAALDACAGTDEVMIIGGAEIFAEALPIANRMHLTLIDATFSGDTWLPDDAAREWREISREDRARGEDATFAYSFVDLERR